jgi:hypothetical protein
MNTNEPNPLFLDRSREDHDESQQGRADSENARPAPLEQWPSSPTSAARLAEIRRRWRAAGAMSRQRDSDFGKNNSDD